MEYIRNTEDKLKFLTLIVITVWSLSGCGGYKLDNTYPYPTVAPQTQSETGS